ncbi:M16 family metallopeptidase [Chelativorans salis]|uniref:Insulinase family protein n=1 Tax=Chelativorans salis TaxID=2978478 RepID=A0ABT2LL04_9HYPH|nr:pitrilysin family protein [Chelativorans sp. EGI FJ00035]MCT7373864.1 insulinase family protein [Chelativorans sp. EGI FJ00035]
MRYYLIAARMAALCLVAAAPVIWLMFAPAASAEAAAPGAVEAESFELDNGMQVVVIPQRRAPVVTQMVWYKVGAADEAPGQSGIAHLFEHLMFKATSNQQAGELDKAVTASGGNHNAFTSFDYTAYYQQVPTDALGEMMAFEADRMRNLILSDEVLATERQVVLEERLGSVENRPEGLLSESVYATLFQNHPYGKGIIGWRHEIDAITRQQLVDFYNEHYAPNNAILVVAGDVDTQGVRQLAEETYGKIPRGPRLPPRVRTMEPEPATLRSVKLRDPRVSLPSFSRLWLAPAYFSKGRKAVDALEVLTEILGGGKRSRLYRELVVDKRIASGVSAYLDTSMRDYSLFNVRATPLTADKLDEVERAVMAEMEKIATDGVSEKELHTAKKVLVSGLVFAKQNQLGQAIEYGETLALGGTVEDVGRIRERIEAVTADEIRDAAKKYFDPRRSVAGYLLPEEDEK